MTLSTFAADLMADIEIRRPHDLGLDEARRTAQRWIEDGRARFDLVSTVTSEPDRDIVSFKRAGVQGTLVAAADHFELTATLGFLLRGFSGAIRSEIERQLDALLLASDGAAEAARSDAPSGPGACGPGDRGPDDSQAAKPRRRPASR